MSGLARQVVAWSLLAIAALGCAGDPGVDPTPPPDAGISAVADAARGAPDTGPWDWGNTTKPPPGQAADYLVRTFHSDTANLTLPYRLYVPPSYDRNQRYALILLLHGAGERGTDNMAPLSYALELAGPSVQHRRPAFVVVPQCPGDGQWVNTPWAQGSYTLAAVPQSKPMVAALELLAALRSEYSIDAGRILVTGLSMGGFGAWDAVLRNPELFAAALPICGGGDPTQAARLRGLPIWTFHGSADDVVPVSGTRQMVEALRMAGGNVKYTEYPGAGHNVWGMTYANPEVLGWFIDQAR